MWELKNLERVKEFQDGYTANEGKIKLSNQLDSAKILHSQGERRQALVILTGIRKECLEKILWFLERFVCMTNSNEFKSNEEHDQYFLTTRKGYFQDLENIRTVINEKAGPFGQLLKQSEEIALEIIAQLFNQISIENILKDAQLLLCIIPYFIEFSKNKKVYNIFNQLIEQLIKDKIASQAVFNHYQSSALTALDKISSKYIDDTLDVFKNDHEFLKAALLPDNFPEFFTTCYFHGRIDLCEKVTRLILSDVSLIKLYLATAQTPFLIRDIIPNLLEEYSDRILANKDLLDFFVQTNQSIIADGWSLRFGWKEVVEKLPIFELTPKIIGKDRNAILQQAIDNDDAKILKLLEKIILCGVNYNSISKYELLCFCRYIKTTINENRFSSILVELQSLYNNLYEAFEKIIALRYLTFNYVFKNLSVFKHAVTHAPIEITSELVAMSTNDKDKMTYIAENLSQLNLNDEDKKILDEKLKLKSP